MTLGGLLLANRPVRLIVGVGGRMVVVLPVAFGLGFAATVGLDAEVVRVGTALVDEEAREVEVAVLSGGIGEPDERELDLLVSGVAGFFAASAGARGPR